MIVYQNKAVRDLAWVLESQNILHATHRFQALLIHSSWVYQQHHSLKEWLNSLDNNPNDLIQKIQKKHFTRLGLYFEFLFQYYLESTDNINIISKHQQIYYKNETKGEIDFLIDDNHHHLTHIETAVKYYLHDGPTQQLQYYIGPNRSDNLKQKLSHLLHHQLPITNKPYFPNYNKPIDSKIYLKGYLFYHKNYPQSYPKLLHPTHARGLWFRFTEDKITFNSHHVFAILPRLHWFSNAASVDDIEIYTDERVTPAIEESFHHISEPIMIACLEKRENEWLETQRFFIVPEDWS